MEKYSILHLLLVLSLFSCTCNKKLQNDVVVKTIIEIKEFDEKLEIYLSGYYIAWNKINYEYEIKTIENEHLLLVKIKSETILRKIYEKTLSDHEMRNIFTFIKEHDIEQETELAINRRTIPIPHNFTDPMIISRITIDPNTKWVSPHDFRGSIIINIGDKKMENVIYSSQKFETNLYEVLNILNDFIEEEEYFMPISGVVHHSKMYVAE
jgi:hypothetical protein